MLYEITLLFAADLLIDVILIQEPYILTDLSRKITKSHPFYKLFISVDNWEICLQTISYVCKGAGL